MSDNRDSFWDNYIFHPTKSDKESFSIITHDVLQERKLDLDKIPEKEIDYLIQNINYLSTPGEAKYHHFGTLPTELTFFKKVSKRSLKKSLWKSLGFTLIFLLLNLSPLLEEGKSKDYSLFDASGFFLIIFGIIPLTQICLNLIQIHRINTNNLPQWLENRKFKRWISQRESKLSWYVPIAMVLVFAFQFGQDMEPIIEVLGLTKPLTESGSYYKLFTVVLVHGNLIHIGFNALAMFFLSKTFLRLASYRWLLITFSISAITGSLMSIVLLPDTTSVGASGAILGLLGFMLTISLRNKAFIPTRFTSNLFSYVFLTAVLGVFALNIIDNGAHLGGLLGGMLVGLFYTKKRLLKRIELLFADDSLQHEKRKTELEKQKSFKSQEEGYLPEDAPPNLR